MISVRCENTGCGKSYQVKDEHAGKRLKCPGCGHPIAIPSPNPSAPLTDPVAAPQPNEKPPGKEVSKDPSSLEVNVVGDFIAPNRARSGRIFATRLGLQARAGWGHYGTVAGAGGIRGLESGALHHGSRTQ